MKKHSISYLIFIVLFLGQCSDQHRTFSINSDPITNSYTRNEVYAFTKFESKSGITEKADSTTLNQRGNVVSIIGFGFTPTNINYKYDSLGRVIEEMQKSDIVNQFIIEYEPLPSKYTLMKHVWEVGRNGEKGELWSNVTVKYDNNLTRILKETEIFAYDNDSTTTKFEYEGGRITKKVIVAKEFRVETRYIYDNTDLERIETIAGKNVIVDYVSNLTGLIDSSLIKDEFGNKMRYFKYYKVR